MKVSVWRTSNAAINRKSTMKKGLEVFEKILAITQQWTQRFYMENFQEVKNHEQPSQLIKSSMNIAQPSLT